MFGMLQDGGAVLWVILACGLGALVVFVERSLHLHRARIKSEDFLKGVFTILKRRNVDEALAICDDTPGPVAHLLKTAILHRHADREDLRTALEESSLAEVSRMERRLVVVATVAQIAPLLGLLGTVLGIVETLMTMRIQAPLVHSVDIMDGLFRALITTAAGLTVAIPCYVAFNLLVVKIDRIVLDMERASSEIMAFITETEKESEDETGSD
jgi:biopolymer transport protein ExbB